jgi:DHA3 family macrolide efflux protein-like MFS transporter
VTSQQQGAKPPRESEPRPGGAYGRLFRNRSFMALWLGQTVSFVGDYFYWLAVPIMIERLTGSTAMVGLSVIFNAIPMLVLGPVAGVFVDRWDRKRTMIVSDLLRALLVLLFLSVRTADQIWIYFVVGFLMSCVSRFFFPAQNALLPLVVVDRDDLLAANGLMQIVQTIGLLVGPAMAGFAMGFWGEQVAFLVDSATFLVSAVFILTMIAPRQPAVSAAAEPVATTGRLASVWNELREGVAHLFGSRTMVGVLICLGVVQLGLGAVNVVWVPYLQRTFGVGAEGLGIVDSAQGAGMVLGAVALGFLTARLTMRILISWSIILIGLLLSGIGLVPLFGYVIALSFGIGVALVPAQSALMTMMQLAVPDPKRGRVGSALNALTTAAGLLSMAAATFFADLIGLHSVYVICGLIAVASGVLGFWVLHEPEAVPDQRLMGST